MGPGTDEGLRRKSGTNDNNTDLRF
jgi:hypothetical protein